MSEQSRANVGGLSPRYYTERTDNQPIAAHKRFPVMLEASGDDPEAVEALAYYAFLKNSRGKNPELAADIMAALADPINAPAQHRYAHGLEITPMAALVAIRDMKRKPFEGDSEMLARAQSIAAQVAKYD